MGGIDSGNVQQNNEDKSGRSGETLVVDFCGDERRVDAADTLSFGREADIILDENPFLHRQLGRFEQRNNLWWLANVGTRIPLEIHNVETRSKAVVPPGTAQVLPAGDVIIRFAAGPTTYELEVAVAASDVEPVVEQVAPSDTVSVGSLPLTDSQRLLIVALAENVLRFPQEDLKLPSNKAAAARLAWSPAQFNRKLDNVCEKLTSAGIPGLKVKPGERNNERRRLLVEAAVSSGLVTSEDLAELDEIEPWD